MSKKIGIICLTLIFALVILSSRTVAQSSAALEGRVSRLEADDFQLRSQLSRIESELAQVTGRRVTPTPNPIRLPAQTPSRTNQPVSSDPMFNRLATLVIELKQRVQALERQVAELKKQRR